MTERTLIVTHTLHNQFCYTDLEEQMNIGFESFLEEKKRRIRADVGEAIVEYLENKQDRAILVCVKWEERKEKQLNYLSLLVEFIQQVEEV